MCYVKTYIGRSTPLFGYRIRFAVISACVLLISSMATVSYAADVKLSDSLENVKISGDFRLRQESFDKTTKGQIDRHRQRFRLRMGADFKFVKNVEVKLRFASGTGEQVSTNQSMDNLSSQKGIWIDRAYLEWKPREYLGLAGGRMANPFWTTYTSDLVWDDDFNPEGLSESLEFLLARGAKFFGKALQMVVDEDSGANQDQFMFGEQAGLEFRLPVESRLKIAGAYYEWTNETTGTFGQAVTNEGNRRVGGILQNEFGVAELTGELSAWIGGKLPLSVQGTFIRNTKAKDSLTPKEDAGYQIGTKIGKAGEAKTWEAAYFYKRVETDATVADVADSDFGDGGANRKGHIFWAAYNPEKWLQVKVKYFTTKVVNETLSPNADDINRIQMDLSVKF